MKAFQQTLLKSFKLQRSFHGSKTHTTTQWAARFIKFLDSLGYFPLSCFSSVSCCSFQLIVIMTYWYTWIDQIRSDKDLLCYYHNWQHINDGVSENIFLSSSFQPSLLSAEPLLPPHNFHSHSLRRLPLYQPLHISQPMPVSLSVGQPTLPPLPGHHRVLPPHTSLSPPRVPPFLSLPRQQSIYRVEQVGLWKRPFNVFFKTHLDHCMLKLLNSANFFLDINCLVVQNDYLLL